MEIKKGCLYIVGTPIGNMSDMSERAIHTLQSVDFVAAEDTRVSGLLLSRLGVKKELLSCHEHNIVSKSETIISRLKKGESCAIVTDAGMPCISDPGELLVKACGENDITVYVVPGPCALTAALAVSGLDTRRFSFEGFLSVAKKQRSAHLDSVKESRSTLVFYEAPHKLKATLADLLETLGDRKIAVCRELTKMYEEVLRGQISDMVRLYDEKSPKGEYVLVIEGAKEPVTAQVIEKSLDKAAEFALRLHKSGTGVSQAAKIAAEENGLRKSDVYKKVLSLIAIFDEKQGDSL